MVSEAHDLILVILSLEEVVASAVVETLFIGAHIAGEHRCCFTHHEFLLGLKGDVAEKDSDIFSLQDAVIVEVVPGKRQTKVGQYNHTQKNTLQS